MRSLRYMEFVARCNILKIAFLSVAAKDWGKGTNCAMYPKRGTQCALYKHMETDVGECVLEIMSTLCENFLTTLFHCTSPAVGPIMKPRYFAHGRIRKLAQPGI